MRKRFTTSFISNPGGQEENEDYFGFVELKKSACWAVADGLGGFGNGNVASQKVVNAVLEYFLCKPDASLESVSDYINHANNEVKKLKIENTAMKKMGSTVAAVATDYKKIVMGHVGDTRIYYFRNNRILSRTRDHSVPQMLADMGEIPEEKVRGHVDRNKLTRAIGRDGELNVTAAKGIKVKGGDKILMCTDGFWEYVTEAEMEIALTGAAAPKEWLMRMEASILEGINEKNDNYTACAVFIENGETTIVNKIIFTIGLMIVLFIAFFININAHSYIFF